MFGVAYSVFGYSDNNVNEPEIVFGLAWKTRLAGKGLKKCSPELKITEEQLH